MLSSLLLKGKKSPSNILQWSSHTTFVSGATVGRALENRWALGRKACAQTPGLNPALSWALGREEGWVAQVLSRAGERKVCWGLGTS